MNDDLFPMQRLDIYQAALHLARRVHEAKLQDPELRDQATRAAKSAFLNLSEALPHDAPGLRRRHLTIANGSLHETVATRGAAGPSLAVTALAARASAQARAVAVKGMSQPQLKEEVRHGAASRLVFAVVLPLSSRAGVAKNLLQLDD